MSIIIAFILKNWRGTLFAVVVMGCSTTAPILPDHVTVPGIRIDTVKVIEIDRVFVTSPCDTGAILDLLCRGSAEGETDGVKWKFAYEKVARENRVLGLLTRRLADSVHVLVSKPETEIVIPEALTQELARLQENQEQHTWVWFVGFTIICGIVGFGLSFLAPLVGIVKRFGA